MKKRVFLAAAVALGTMLMATPVFAGNNGWNRDNRGWWYQFSNGSYARSSCPPACAVPTPGRYTPFPST